MRIFEAETRDWSHIGLCVAIKRVQIEAPTVGVVHSPLRRMLLGIEFVVRAAAELPGMWASDVAIERTNGERTGGPS